MPEVPRVTIVPLVGPFHTRFPRYSVVFVQAILEALEPEAVALASLAPGALADPSWQATLELSLPHVVEPWAQRRGVPLHEVGSVVGEPGEPGESGDEAEFIRFLTEFGDGKARLRRVQAAERPVEQLLTGALDLNRIQRELIPAVAAYQHERSSEFGEGPGTGWLLQRAERMAERVAALPYGHVALLASVDDVPALEVALKGVAKLEAAPGVEPPVDEARQRALLDVAMRGEVGDVAALLTQLRELDSAEARYHEANLLLANDHAMEALERLRDVLRGDFFDPYYLPGFVLARIGQLYDLAGDRDAARRSYRGVLALSFAPPEAVTAAHEGLEVPFAWQAGNEDATPEEP